MSTRGGASLVETLVVIAILSILLALFLPAVLSARQKALEMTCKNNLRQINLAVAGYAELNKRLPSPGPPGAVGGWTVDVLPFLDQQNLANRVTPGVSIPAAPDFLLRQPVIFRCPVRGASDGPGGAAMDEAHYVFAPGDRRKSFLVADAPLDLHAPWASGPEVNFWAGGRRAGPHHGGFFYASGFQEGVGFMPGAEATP